MFLTGVPGYYGYCASVNQSILQLKFINISTGVVGVTTMGLPNLSVGDLTTKVLRELKVKAQDLWKQLNRGK